MADSKWQPPMGACWVISWKPPLILGRCVLNDIWTIVQITCVTYRARPAGSLLQVTVTFQEHLHLKSMVTHPCALRLENLP